MSGKRISGKPALSQREREIVDMLADGQPNKVIAGELGISRYTVDSHLRRLFAKFRVTSRTALVVLVLKGGFLGTNNCRNTLPGANSPSPNGRTMRCA